MANIEGEDMLERGRVDAMLESPIFATYMEAAEARQEADRRSRDKGNGTMTRVVRSPYGGYVIRSWPLDLLVEPELQHVTTAHGRSAYADM